MPDYSAITLLLLAGGLGSRFGGTKQLAAVGPRGSAILDHSIREAAAVGVTRVVVVGRTDLDEDIQRHLVAQHGEDLNLVMVHQDAFGPARARPWGTGHAVVSARAALDGPVVVLNADDHYGPTGIARIVKSLSGAESTIPSAAMLGFQLGRTLPETGTVSRGICTRDGTGRLIGLVETHGIGRYGDAIRAVDPVGELSPEASVSMNLWALPMAAIDRLAEQWLVFQRNHADSPTAEFLLPEALEEQRVEGRLSIEVVDTDEDWIGITNREDLEVARSAFAAMRVTMEGDSGGAR
ncbi:MAG: NTP transferase domain-containing protein [Actinomycetota bacterium]|nr:NTP transferase domain-containing protein [Actinomycetota bacterium]